MEKKQNLNWASLLLGLTPPLLSLLLKKNLLNSISGPVKTLESDRMLSHLHYLSIQYSPKQKLSVWWWLLITGKPTFLFLLVESESCLTLRWFSKFNKFITWILILGDYNEAKNFADFFALNIISFPQVLRWFSIINLKFWTGFTWHYREKHLSSTTICLQGKTMTTPSNFRRKYRDIM